MFYEEKLICGEWYWRGTPNGEWVMFSRERLLTKINQILAEQRASTLHAAPQINAAAAHGQVAVPQELWVQMHRALARAEKVLGDLTGNGRDEYYDVCDALAMMDAHARLAAAPEPQTN